MMKMRADGGQFRTCESGQNWGPPSRATWGRRPTSVSARAINCCCDEYSVNAKAHAWHVPKHRRIWSAATPQQTQPAASARHATRRAPCLARRYSRFLCMSRSPWLLHWPRGRPARESIDTHHTRARCCGAAGTDGIDNLEQMIAHCNFASSDSTVVT
ncbi:hypothetical protein BCR44DRAFT_1432549 [Catenaria anguillulae PL171]|uniref:Uncharacterized protein n=1 Tax=Catenaria anguillulae PL171 TaxID=765915 RepID=A0A1Y2HTA3_9FUNG|nr:hypothetical protein BCR44DRAFT_1432549 [Catenaria anguillulae PL171]